MNRRSFIVGILSSGVCSAVLPSALTYERTWKLTRNGIYAINPEWYTAPYELSYLFNKPVDIGVYRTLSCFRSADLSGKRFKYINDRFVDGTYVPGYFVEICKFIRQS